jgi:hypothetical protein
VDDFSLECRKQLGAVVDLRREIIAAKGDRQATQLALKTFNERWDVQGYLTARDALKAAAPFLLERIINADERPR